MKRLVKTMLCLLLCICLCGCWSSQEPKYLAIVDSLVYDITERGQYRVVMEILNPAVTGGKDKGSSQKKPHVICVGEGNTARTALNNISVSMEHSIFGGQNKVRFFSRALAFRGIGETIDYFMRDHLTDETPYMAVIESGDPLDLYNSATGLSETVGGYFDLLSIYQPQSMSRSVFVTTLDFIKDYYDEGKQPVMGLVRLVENKAEPAETGESSTPEGEAKKYQIEYEGLAAFKGDKFVGTLNGVEARSYNHLTNKLKTTRIYVPYEGGNAVIEMHTSDCTIKAALNGDKVSFDVKIAANMGLVTVGGSLDVRTEEAFRVIEQSYKEKTEQEITDVIQRMQREMKSDIFGFGSALHTQFPDPWKELKENWDDKFSEADIRVTVDAVLDRTGEVKQPFLLKEEN